MNFFNNTSDQRERVNTPSGSSNRLPGLPDMITLGLIGGIGSGKSAVARLFAQLGAGVVDADQIGHQVLEFSNVKDAVRNRWGDAVFGSNGEVDRRAVAEIVFAPTEFGRRELGFLTSLTHPLIRQVIDVKLREMKKFGKKVAVLDAAILIESGWRSVVDKVIFVDAPRKIRLQRVLQRGWTEVQFDLREQTQLSLDTKRAAADWVVDNSGILSTTLDQIEFFWQNTVGRSK